MLPSHPPGPELLHSARKGVIVVFDCERGALLVRDNSDAIVVGRPQNEAFDGGGEVGAVAEGVHEAGEAAVGVESVGGKGVEEVEEDWLGDGAEVLARCAEVGGGGLVVDGGFVVGDFADAGMAAVDAEVLADFGDDLEREGEQGRSRGSEIEICHSVLYGRRQRKVVVRSWVRWKRRGEVVGAKEMGEVRRDRPSPTTNKI